MDVNNAAYWQSRYLENATGWDLGAVSPPLKTYFDQLDNKELKILIPGAGNAYEAEYLYQKGFQNVWVADWAEHAINNLKNRLPGFPEAHLLVQDFFKIDQKFDLVIEQTFFCAITPDLRKSYVQKMKKILKPKGKLVGLLFQIPLNSERPPFGACKEEYLDLFSKDFTIRVMETAHNSISPRMGNELFVIMQAKH